MWISVDNLDEFFYLLTSFVDIQTLSQEKNVDNL